MAASARRSEPLFTALATTEPESGSDAASIATTAVRVEGGYAISGQKVWISNAGLADQYVVFAKTDPSRGSSGVTAFLLRKGAEGMRFGEPMRKMGQRAIVCREIFLDEVFVPESDRLGDEGQGFRGLMKTFDISRIVLAAAATGAARAAYEYALAYARERKQFGKPIVEHQPSRSGWPTWRPGSSPRGCSPCTRHAGWTPERMPPSSPPWPSSRPRRPRWR